MAFIFVNASVYGPCVPRYVDKNQWTSFFTNKMNDKIKLVGCTTNFQCGHHIQSYCWAVDKVFLKALLSIGYFKDTDTDPDKWFYVCNYEIRNIQLVHQFGYEYYTFEYFRDFPEPIWNLSVSFNDVYEHQFGASINPFEFMFVKPDYNKENGSFQYIVRMDNIK
jgi:hypothetical protein